MEKLAAAAAAGENPGSDPPAWKPAGNWAICAGTHDRLVYRISSYVRVRAGSANQTSIKKFTNYLISFSITYILKLIFFCEIRQHDGQMVKLTVINTRGFLGIQSLSPHIAL